MPMEAVENVTTVTASDSVFRCRVCECPRATGEPVESVHDQREKPVRGASRRQHLDKLDDSDTTDDS